MKNKIVKILIVFILLFSVGITTVYAEPIARIVGSQNQGQMVNDGIITKDWYNPDGVQYYCAASTDYSCKRIYGNWNLYSVEKDGQYYILYCLNPSKDIQHNDIMLEYNDLDSARFSDPNLPEATKKARKELLKKLLLYGFNPNSTNNLSLDDRIASDSRIQLKLIAMQILVWEVMEGGRTSFETIEPQWNGTYSFYNQIIKPNGKDSNQTNTLYYYYKQYIHDAKVGDQANPSPAFNESSYTLSWDSANRKYKATVSGIGDYDTCVSDNNKVHVYTENGSAIITADTAVRNAKITCKYFRGTGKSDQSQPEMFKYYRYTTDTDASQDMVSGSGWKIYSKSFNVNSENTDFSIKKVDDKGRDLYVNGSDSSKKVKFKLRHTTNKDYVVTLESNSTTHYSLNYSGRYIVSEVEAPKGYDKLQDFYITISAKTHKVTACDGEKKDNRGNVISCLNRTVSINYNGDAIELVVKNNTKHFKIVKTDLNGNAITGTSFEIRDSKNNVMKFNFDGKMFEYDPSGTLTTLNSDYMNTYHISKLPEGEYKIVETFVPYPHRLPSNEDERTTWIRLDSSYNLLVWNNSQKTYVSAGSATVIITNYLTKFTIHKVGHSNPLEGVQFELYDSRKENKIKCRMVSAGVYDYVDNQDTEDNSIYVTNQDGNITINNIPEGIYWIKEVYTIPPYVLPTGDAVYTKIGVNIDYDGVAINNSYTNDTIEISNTPNSFNFYKKDTEGNSLTTGKYKLQKYDKETKKYVDLKLTEVPNDGTYNQNTTIYKVDNENGKIQFTLTKGVATFIDMESSSTYRIIETVAPEGYTKASTKDAATVYIDEYGNASGLLVLVDQKIVKEDDSAYAELIINIQTGKERIMYGALIAIVVGIIAGLILYNKKK